jgi:hypothetical protein
VSFPGVMNHFDETTSLALVTVILQVFDAMARPNYAVFKYEVQLLASLAADKVGIHEMPEDMGALHEKFGELYVLVTQHFSEEAKNILTRAMLRCLD